MDIRQEWLLENLADALDHLYDRTVRVYDLYIIVYATYAAIANDDQRAILNQACEELMAILKLAQPEGELNTKALRAMSPVKAFLP